MIAWTTNYSAPVNTGITATWRGEEGISAFAVYFGDTTVLLSEDEISKLIHSATAALADYDFKDKAV